MYVYIELPVCQLFLYTMVVSDVKSNHPALVISRLWKVKHRQLIMLNYCYTDFDILFLHVFSRLTL